MYQVEPLHGQDTYGCALRHAPRLMLSKMATASTAHIGAHFHPTLIAQGRGLHCACLSFLGARALLLDCTLSTEGALPWSLFHMHVQSLPVPGGPPAASATCKTTAARMWHCAGTRIAFNVFEPCRNPCSLPAGAQPSGAGRAARAGRDVRPRPRRGGGAAGAGCGAARQRGQGQGGHRRGARVRRAHGGVSAVRPPFWGGHGQGGMSRGEVCLYGSWRTFCGMVQQSEAGDETYWYRAFRSAFASTPKTKP